MKQKESRLEDLFHEFQSSFNKANSEEKRLLAARFYTWIYQQVDSVGNLVPNHYAGGTQGISKHSMSTAPVASETTNRLDSNWQGVKNLVESKINIHQIAENIEQVFWLNDIQSGRFLYISPAFEMVWGRSCESLYSDPSILLESVHPEDRVQVMVARSHNDQKPLNQTYRILRPDGGLRWIFERTFSLQDETPESRYHFCIAHDVTDQKRIELELRKTLDRIREQFDLSHRMSLARKPEAVLKTLMSAIGLRSAQRAAMLFFEDPKVGPTRGTELIAAWPPNLNIFPWSTESNLYEEPALWELFHPNRTIVITGIQNDQRLVPLVRDFLMEGQIQTLVIFPLIASGDWIGCLLVFYRHEHSFDHIELRQLKVLVDQATITLRNLRLLEVEEESRLIAEHANEIKTEFLAMISHELRTPLTSIIGFTTTLLADDVVWEPEEESDFIQTIQREAKRLQELIDHLLDLSRLEAGMMPITQNPHSISEIFADVLPQFQVLTNGHKILMHLPANLPLVNVDPKRIGQVLVNLVRNASAYAPKGTEISITAGIKGRFLQINVNDQGPGIPPAEHKRVFKAFLRGENVEHGPVQGAGLGLAICKGLIEAHGGRIWIKKKTTPGATISFTVPIVSSIIENGSTGEEQ